MKFDKDNKKNKRINIKVIAASVVAITLIGIVGISIGRYSGANPINTSIVLDTMTAIGSSINKGFTFLEDNFNDVINYKKNAREIERIKEENEELKQEVVALNNELQKTESLENLKKAINFVDEEYEAEVISASVVGKNDGNWYTSFVIGAGSKDGVKKDSVVVNGSGLVGIVYEVSEHYSKAISLLDSKSSVSFKLLKDPDLKGVITQNASLQDKENYKNDGYIYGYMFDTSYNVLPGDVVITSGLGIYPEGIPVGEVDMVIEDKNSSMKYITVKPYADFKNVDDVTIIEPRDIG